MKYRPEIDGLRAFAVLPVIFFHAGFSVFQGGFIGVDIFFVISGFLITRILIDDINQGNFSLVNFYERRARRILPVLFVILIVTMVLSLFILSPKDIENFSFSLLSVVSFISNIYFWLNTGYFDTQSELQLLLHTWSLAVEEQFYLFFPPLLFLLCKYVNEYKKAIIFMCLIASLALAQWGVVRIPSAAFYLLPTRAWELFMGVTCALILNSYNIDYIEKYSQPLSLLGLFLIVISIVSFSVDTLVPSFYVVIPTLGAVLIILFAEPKTYVCSLLSYTALVRIGLISYSIYLWHQPVFVLARHKFIEIEMNVGIYILLILLTVFLALLTWKFVEKPFRDRKVISLPLFLKYILVVLISIIIFSVVGIKTDGYKLFIYKYKYNYDAATIERLELIEKTTEYDLYKHMHQSECAIWVKNTQALNKENLQACQEKHGEALVVLGDSHAMNLYNIIAKSSHVPFIIGVSQGGCRVHNNYSHCHYDNFKQFLSTSNFVEEVIYHQAGSYLILDNLGNVDNPKVFETEFAGFSMENIEAIKKYLVELNEAFSIKTTWVGPFREYRKEPRVQYALKGDETINPESIRIFLELGLLLEEVNAEHNKYSYLGFEKLFDNPEVSFKHGCFMFRDGDHFSRCGEKILSKSLQLKEKYRP